MNTFKAVSRLNQGLKVESTARNYKLIIDEPTDLGGSDEGMNPVEALLQVFFDPKLTLCGGNQRSRKRVYFRKNRGTSVPALSGR